MTAQERCARIHRTLDSLPLNTGGPHPGLPKSGLYFFYQEGEICSHTAKARITRVGNHPRAQNGLVKRLQMHYRGNKNSSVFRKFLGGALLRSQNPSHPCLQPAPGRGHWERQNAKACALCKPTEAQVTRLLREVFWFRCVEIVAQDERNRLEEGIVASLAACPTCLPSPNWLGRHAYSLMVQESGLWNSNYVRDSLPLSEEELSRLEILAHRSLGSARTEPEASRSPNRS